MVKCKAVKLFRDQLAEFKAIDSRRINDVAKLAMQAAAELEAINIKSSIMEIATRKRQQDDGAREFAKNKMAVFCVVDSIMRHSKKVADDPYEKVLDSYIEAMLKSVVRCVGEDDQKRISKNLAKWQQKKWFGGRDFVERLGLPSVAPTTTRRATVAFFSSLQSEVQNGVQNNNFNFVSRFLH